MSPLDELGAEAFARRLIAAWPAGASSPDTVRRLHAHYLELRRWEPRIDLIGPGAGGEIFERHYAESLAGLPWLPFGAFRLVDVGSGAGFPGFILAAARPEAEVWLVEPRQRKLAFLAAAGRRAGLAVHGLDARVAAPRLDALPEAIDIVTLRALRLAPRDLEALAHRLAPGGRLIVWEGAEPTELPDALAPSRRTLLAGTTARHLAEYRRRADLPAEEAAR